jgi:hypothetical protein
MPNENEKAGGEPADDATRRRLMKKKKAVIWAAKTKKTLVDDDIVVGPRGERRPMSELLRFFNSPGQNTDPTDPILTFDLNATDLCRQTDSDDPEAGGDPAGVPILLPPDDPIV